MRLLLQTHLSTVVLLVLGAALFLHLNLFASLHIQTTGNAKFDQAVQVREMKYGWPFVFLISRKFEVLDAEYMKTKDDGSGLTFTADSEFYHVERRSFELSSLLWDISIAGAVLALVGFSAEYLILRRR